MRYLLHQLLEHSARRFPDRPAVVDGDRTLTYAELDARTNRLANLLVREGVGVGDRVGVYLDKALEAVVGIYGILKSGGVYVPMDPQAPVERLGYIARNCGMGVVVTGIEKSAEWEAILAGAPAVRALVVANAADVQGPPSTRVLSTADIDGAGARSPNVPQIGSDLAYILYTSGSTGEPKGVMLSHLNCLTFVNWAVERFGVIAGDRLSSHAPLHFDLSTFDLYGAAHAGAAVVLVPPKTSVFPVEVARFIRDQRITVWYSVPSVLSMLAVRGGLGAGEFPSLRTILFAGEVFPMKYLRRLMELLPHVGFFNLYGPTETNVCTYYEVPPLDTEMTDAIPIGAAIDDVDVFAVTDDGRPAAIGEPGELYVRGSSVMHGYWGDPERSARTLVPHPFASGVRDLAYRTGDLVVLEPDGQYRLLGRRDSQIKSRGYRIELGDVEAALYAHPDVEECAVVAVPDDLVTNRIAAYVVVRGDTGPNDLVSFCAQRIPRYMIPEAFHFRDALPKGATGKIDRRRLSSAMEESGRTQ